jgi:hypothetical protein
MEIRFIGFHLSESKHFSIKIGLQRVGSSDKVRQGRLCC